MNTPHLASADPLTLSPFLARVEEEHLMIIAMMIGAAIVLYVIHCIRSVYETRAREITKRELAAYVAEGTLKPDDAAKMLAIHGNDVEKTIADAVACGNIKPEKAEQLFRSLRAEPGRVAAADVHG